MTISSFIKSFFKSRRSEGHTNFELRHQFLCSIFLCWCAIHAFDIRTLKRSSFSDTVTVKFGLANLIAEISSRQQRLQWGQFKQCQKFSGHWCRCVFQLTKRREEKERKSKKLNLVFRQKRRTFSPPLRFCSAKESSEIQVVKRNVPWAVRCFEKDHLWL